MKHFLKLCFLSLFVFSSCVEQTEENTYDLVIKNATILWNGNKILEEPYWIYIENGKIGELDPIDTAKVLFARDTLDASGLYLLPGLWDNHAHFRGGAHLIDQNEKFLGEYIKYGITTVRDAGGDLTPQVQQWNAAIQAGEKVGPTIFTSGPKLDGPDARWAGSLEVETPQDVTNALDSLQSIGTDYVKLYDSTVSRDMYLDIIRQAESRGIITSGHMPFTVTLEEAITAGLDNVEHLYYILKGCSAREQEITEQVISGKLSFWGSMTALIESYDEETAQRTFKKLKDNQVSVTPTLHIGEVLSYMDEQDHSQDAALGGLSDEFIDTYQGRIRGAMNASAKAKEERKALQRFFNTLALKLNKAGVSLLAGSDSGAYNSYVYSGSSLHKELAQLVKAGLSPAEALKTSGYHGSRFLKKPFGIKEGLPADFVLLRKNPLEDIKNTLEIEMVIKNGKVVYKK